MDLYSLILNNKIILEALYTLIIVAICMIISIKADRFYQISLHNGIRYFRNAFIFFGAGFLARYIFGLLSDLALNNLAIVKVAFEYLIIMAGFFLFYSLIWKKFASQKEYSSLFNSKIIVFHFMALVLSIIDVVWETYNFMFFSQIIIFFYTTIISLTNLRNSEKRKFLKSYFVGMLLVLSAWVLNFLAAEVFLWSPRILIGIGFINIAFFFLFLYGVIRNTKSI